MALAYFRSLSFSSCYHIQYIIHPAHIMSVAIAELSLCRLSNLGLFCKGQFGVQWLRIAQFGYAEIFCAIVVILVVLVDRL